jgi:hypothetical protein
VVDALQPPTCEALGLTPEADLARLLATIEHNPRLKWGIIQRGLWEFTVHGYSDGISCPVLGTMADADPLARNAEAALAETLS